jgi:DNA-binding NtrC family response regulator
MSMIKASGLPQTASTILIIDDDSGSTKNIYQFLFEREGYRVLTASNGLEGLEILKREHQFPDLLLLDCSMPHMNGEEFLLKLKAEMPQIFLETKVVGFTCFDSGSLFFQKIKELAFDCREKPGDIAGVLRLASDYL